MVVSSATLTKDAFATVYDLLTGASGITDPASRGLTRTKWVFSAFPDEFGDDFPDYPILTIETDFGDDQIVLGKNARKADIIFRIVVFAKKAEYVDTLTDDVRNILVSNQATMEAAGLFKPKFTNTDKTTIFRDKDKIHTRTIFVSYRWCG